MMMLLSTTRGARTLCPAAFSGGPSPRGPRQQITSNLSTKAFEPPAGSLFPMPVEILEAVPKANLQTADYLGWNIKDLKVPEVWKTTKGEGVKVCVIDTGVDMNHPDLQGQVIATKDFTGEGDASAQRDFDGHGTHCCGIVAASLNSLGVAGVAPEAKLMSAKVFRPVSRFEILMRIALGWPPQLASSPEFGDLAAAINWAVAEGADVISMSLTGPSPDPRIKAACMNAIVNGCIVVAAAGNYGLSEDEVEGSIGYPANYEQVICVGAVNRDLKRAAFSSSGNNIDVMAPGGAAGQAGITKGQGILSCWPPHLNNGNAWNVISGTSMATPFVAGVCALARAASPEPLNQAAMMQKLKENAQDIGAPGFDKKTGWGLIQVNETVKPVPDNSEQLVF